MRELVRMIEKAKRNDSGFTLVELLVVVAIIGVLVAIIVPVMGGQTEQAANSAHEANVRTLKSIGSQLTAFYGNPDGSITLPDDANGSDDIGEIDGWNDDVPDLSEYLDEWPTVPDNVDEGAYDNPEDNEDNEGLSDFESGIDYEMEIHDDGSMYILGSEESD